MSFISVLAYIVLLTGMTVTTTGDIYCEEECVSYINITSTYWRVCFADNFSLIQTDPDVPVDVYVPARGVGNWRLFDHTKDCIERKTSYRPLPNRFKIVGHKEPGQTVKWWSDDMKVDDPLWIGKEGEVGIEFDVCVLNDTFDSTYILSRGSEIINHPNGTVENKTTYVTETVLATKCLERRNMLIVNNVMIDTAEEYHLMLYYENATGELLLSDMWDGDGTENITDGESYCKIKNKKIKCYGHNGKFFQLKFKEIGIDEDE